MPPDRFSNRELSWLDFNERVLALAEDDRQPLLERAKFLAIFASNLDEFYMVRVAGLKRRRDMGLSVTVRRRTDRLGATHADLRAHPGAGGPAGPLLHRRRAAGVAGGGDPDRALGRHRARRTASGWPTTSRRQIFPVLTPLAVDPGAPVPLHLRAEPDRWRSSSATRRPGRSGSPGSRCRTTSTGSSGYAAAVDDFLPIEDLIAAHLDELFPGMDVLEHQVFRVTRNADVEVEEDRDEDLLQALERELARRRFGPPVRLEVTDTTSERVLALLLSELDVDPADAVEVPGLLDLSSLWQLYGLDRPTLKDPPFVPATNPAFAEGETPKSVFATLRDGDVLLHHPYESFATTVQRFIEQAAADPRVLAIKQTLYRTSGDSPIVDALISAAAAGKQVVALVEIKARFDEQANISWAKALERAGVHVVYGLVGLKTHCKIALVIRQEGKTLRRYCHIGTGNYNPKTATDLRGSRPADGRPGHRRRPHRPVQRAHRLLPADRVPEPAGRTAFHPQRHRGADRARDRASARRPRRAGPAEDELDRGRGRDRRAVPGVEGRGDGRPDRARDLRAARRRARAVARTSPSDPSSAGSWSTRGSSTSATAGRPRRATGRAARSTGSAART